MLRSLVGSEMCIRDSRKVKTIAMIGISSEKKGEDPKNLKRKPANVVMTYMQKFGYKVYPINPFAEGEIINGEKS